MAALSHLRRKQPDLLLILDEIRNQLSPGNFSLARGS